MRRRCEGKPTGDLPAIQSPALPCCPKSVRDISIPRVETYVKLYSSPKPPLSRSWGGVNCNPLPSAQNSASLPPAGWEGGRWRCKYSSTPDFALGPDEDSRWSSNSQSQFPILNLNSQFSISNGSEPIPPPAADESSNTGNWGQPNTGAAVWLGKYKVCWPR